MFITPSYFSFALSPQSNWNIFKTLLRWLLLPCRWYYCLLLPLHSLFHITLITLRISRAIWSDTSLWQQKISDIRMCECTLRCVPFSANPKAHALSRCVCVFVRKDSRTREVECRAVVLCTDERCTHDVRRFCKSCGGQLSHTNRESFKVLL